MKWEVNLAPELDAWIQNELRTGNWGTPDVLFTYAIAVIRGQIERAKSDGTMKMLEDLQKKVAAEQAMQQQQKPSDDLLGGMMSAVPIAATPTASATAEPLPPEVENFLKQLQSFVTQQQKKP